MPTYYAPTAIAFPPTGDQVGTTLRPGDRYGWVPTVEMSPASNQTPTTGQIWPRGNP